MPASSRVRAAQTLVAGALVAGALTAIPSDAQQAHRRIDPNTTGAAAGSLASGAGNLKVTLTTTSDGRILVRWKRPAPASRLKKFTVTVGVNRQLDARVKTYAVSRKRQSLVVARAGDTELSSGNYSFVKVTVYRKTGQVGASPTKWIQAPLASACTAAPEDQVTVGTFNIRSWAADGRKGTTAFGWGARGANVISNILNSGARAIAVQEASGPADSGFGPQTQDEWVLDRLNADDPDPSSVWVDALDDEAYRPPAGHKPGFVGTRVFYDANRFTELESGLYRLSDPRAVDSLVPWARLQAKGGTQAPFILTSNHLDVGETRTDFDIRATQVAQLVPVVKELMSRHGDQVIVAGDLNSTANTNPYNNVQRELLRAGLYDSYATSNIVGGQFSTTNMYKFPVRPTPLRRDYIMTAGPVSGSCGYRNMAYTQKEAVASDHFMQVATLPLPPA